jgi:pyruvate dehydrogenase E1 component beta subunit
MKRERKFSEAIHEALDLSMAADPAVYVMGLGVPDPKGIFGSTLGLQQKYGEGRVLDMPAAENGMTGVAIGSALAGMKPVMTHQRVDFALLAVEQLVNQAAKWHYMFGGQKSIPLVVRMIIGRGWGQGPQHSQSLQAWFGHIPGLKVVMPATPYDAKGLLISSIEDPNPVIFLEHRWLYDLVGHVPEGLYRVPLGKASILRGGKDLTIVGVSFMALEALRSAEILRHGGVEAEVIDIRSIRPLDEASILQSIKKTGHLIVADTGWRTGGFSAEILARVAEKAWGTLKCPPKRVALPDCPTPTSHALANRFYPQAGEIVNAAREMLGLPGSILAMARKSPVPQDIPDLGFTGPF